MVKIHDLRKQLEQKSRLDNLVSQYQPTFDEIDDILRDLQMDNISDERSLLSAQTRLTGLYGSLITVYKMAEAAKINMEAKTFVELEENYKKKHPKAKPLSAAKLAKLTNQEIGIWRTIRNIFESYVLASEKAIITCQSNLKNLKSERIFNNANPERH